jgi:hypothetical protein
MAGRTHLKHCRVYADGVDLSGFTRDIGPLATEFAAEAEAALSDAIKHVMGGPGAASLKVGTLNGFFDNSANGLHELHSAPGSLHVVTVALGDGAAPAAGMPAFGGAWHQNSYHVSEGDGALAATLEFGEWAAGAVTPPYSKAWGVIVHPNAQETAANNGTASHDNGAATSGGGYGVLQVLDGDGDATISIQHADTDDDSDFDSTGAVITFSTVDTTSPFGEIAATATRSTQIERYTRWQVSLSTATYVRFALMLVRG